MGPYRWDWGLAVDGTLFWFGICLPQPSLIILSKYFKVESNVKMRYSASMKELILKLIEYPLKHFTDGGGGISFKENVPLRLVPLFLHPLLAA